MRCGARKAWAQQTTMLVLAGMALCQPRMVHAQSSELASQSRWAISSARLAAAEDAVDALPDAPSPQNMLVDGAESDGPQQQKPTTPGFPPVSPRASAKLPEPARLHPEIPALPPACISGMSMGVDNQISCARRFDSFQRFLDSTDIHPLSTRQKGVLALRNFSDPYNFATIAVLSGISVAQDPRSPYGPGMPGFARNFGVASCESAVSEFFGTFLIPAVTHQDPHYHRMPNASYPRRILHAISQVGWAQSDFGDPMPNYSVLVTTAVGDGLANLYVPGRPKDWGTAVTRYATAVATDPIDNFITEFVPDVAKRVNIRIVLIQRVIDRVERGQ